MLQSKAIEIANNFNYQDFVASKHWIELFMKRNDLASRKITNVGQEDARSNSEIHIVCDYFSHLQYVLVTKEIANCEIYNMDETPVYIDMMNSRTISFKGEKNAEARGTGHNKTRLTVVLGISNSGKMLRAMVILKGLKNVPRCEIPKNIFVCTSKSGIMNTELMNMWIKTCFNTTGPLRSINKKLLLLDSFAAHKEDGVKSHLIKENAEIAFIPPRMTSFLQPLDVLINASFKASLKNQWNEWLINGPKCFTKSGYRQKPSWQIILDSISIALNQITPVMSIKSFRLCGILDCVSLTKENLNSKLANILYCNNDYNELDSISMEECESNDENLMHDL